MRSHSELSWTVPKELYACYAQTLRVVNLIGGWGGESAAAPTGKSFRFVRACERAGARAARDQLWLPRGFCETNVSFFCPRVAFFTFLRICPSKPKCCSCFIHSKTFPLEKHMHFFLFVFCSFLIGGQGYIEFWWLVKVCRDRPAHSLHFSDPVDLHTASLRPSRTVHCTS